MKNLENLKEKVVEMLNIKAIVEYYHNCEHLEYTRFYLPLIQPIFRIKEFSESYILDKPAKFEKGLPVFIIVKNFPISITFEMINVKERNNLMENGLNDLIKTQNIENKEKITEFVEMLKDNMKIKEKFPNSQEMDATLNSAYTTNFFKKHGIEFKDIIFILLFVIIGCAFTYIITISSIEPIEVIKYVAYTNETIVEMKGMINYIII